MHTIVLFIHNTQQKLRFAFIFLQLLSVNHVKLQYFLCNRGAQRPAWISPIYMATYIANNHYCSWINWIDGLWSRKKDVVLWKAALTSSLIMVDRRGSPMTHKSTKHPKCCRKPWIDPTLGKYAVWSPKCSWNPPRYIFTNTRAKFRRFPVTDHNNNRRPPPSNAIGGCLLG